MRILRLKEVISSTGLSRSTIYQYISDDQFPKPVPLGGRAVGWIDTEVDEWIMSRLDARGGAECGAGTVKASQRTVAVNVVLLAKGEGMSESRRGELGSSFISALNVQIGQNIEERRKVGEILPDHEVSQYWVKSSGKKNLKHKLMFLVSVEAFEALSHLPLEYSGLGSLIEQAWADVLGFDREEAARMVELDRDVLLSK